MATENTLTKKVIRDSNSLLKELDKLDKQGYPVVEIPFPGLQPGESMDTIVEAYELVHGVSSRNGKNFALVLLITRDGKVSVAPSLIGQFPPKSEVKVTCSPVLNRDGYKTFTVSPKD